ncbi:MAG TPA: hypothetical protein VNA89_01250, partial [Gemmatimonadaceae bacterium]|nr:hypothetical protein [Gemmatimonadaceae bacterium]
MTDRQRDDLTAEDEELRDPLLRDAAAVLRAPAGLDPALPARVVARARAAGAPRGGAPGGRRLSLSPWAALAAGLACVALGAG